MVSGLISALLMAVASTATPPQVSALEPVGDGGRHCLPDRSVCLALEHGEEGAELPPQLLVIEPASAEAAERVTTLALPFAPEEREWLTLWPQLILLSAPSDALEGQPAPILIGLLANSSTMYSGGGGEAARLHLFELARAYGSPRLTGERLAVPWTSQLMIRACFTENDMRERRGACHDEYRFGATLDLALQPSAQVWPDLTYRTTAESFPRTSARSADSSGQRLSRADLVWQADAECSYTRHLRYNPASERYEMDQPAPECSDFTVP
jgi:hypothetical protein